MFDARFGDYFNASIETHVAESGDKFLLAIAYDHRIAGMRLKYMRCLASLPSEEVTQIVSYWSCNFIVSQE
jgi:hypothetical protein